MDDIVDRLTYGATCPISAPGGDLAKDMLEGAFEIRKLRHEVADAAHDGWMLGFAARGDIEGTGRPAITTLAFLCGIGCGVLLMLAVLG